MEHQNYKCSTDLGSSSTLFRFVPHSSCFTVIRHALALYKTALLCNEYKLDICISLWSHSTCRQSVRPNSVGDECHRQLSQTITNGKYQRAVDYICYVLLAVNQPVIERKVTHNKCRQNSNLLHSSLICFWSLNNKENGSLFCSFNEKNVTKVSFFPQKILSGWIAFKPFVVEVARIRP